MQPSSSPPRPLPDPASLALPAARIQTEADLAHFLASPGCTGYRAWLQAVARTLIGKPLPTPKELEGRRASEVVRGLLALLAALKQSIADHPPSTSSQRYGNLSFRPWAAAALAALPALVDALLPPAQKPYLPHLLPLLTDTSPFGNATRLDYGTGHETAFFLFLYALRVCGALGETDDEDVGLVVFPAYLDLVWALQDTYRLEPAGSHGVWGLDDYSFLPYFFGSAQLLSSPELPADLLPSSSRAATTRLRDPMSEATSVPVAGGRAVRTVEGLGGREMWSLSLRRVDQLKSGPWSEHSPLLYGLSTQVAKGWPKIHDGLRKMYDAEVLGKLVVVRGLRVGGLLEW